MLGAAVAAAGLAGTATVMVGVAGGPGAGAGLAEHPVMAAAPIAAAMAPARAATRRGAAQAGTLPVITGSLAVLFIACFLPHLPCRGQL